MMPNPNECDGTQPVRLLHTMLRVRDLERSLTFYMGKLGMRLFRQEMYPDGRFTLAFIGYGDESSNAAIELTWNWDREAYELGSAFGHIALSVKDIVATCSALAASGVNVIRQPGPMSYCQDRSSAEQIAFIEDPDGYRIELIQSIGGASLSGELHDK